jgi:hypothetical protein
MPTLNNTKASHNPRWDPAILALLEGSTREKAAAAAGINAATLYRWQKDPQFQKAMLDARREVFGQAMGQLQQASSTAVETLVKIMTDLEAHVGGRVQACKCVLELSRKSLELDDLKIQVEELQNFRRAIQKRSLYDAEPSPTNRGPREIPN